MCGLSVPVSVFFYIFILSRFFLSHMTSHKAWAYRPPPAPSLANGLEWIDECQELHHSQWRHTLRERSKVWRKKCDEHLTHLKWGKNLLIMYVFYANIWYTLLTNEAILTSKLFRSVFMTGAVKSYQVISERSVTMQYAVSSQIAR